MFIFSGFRKNDSNTAISQSATPNKRAQTETTSVLSVNSSFSSNRASNLASLPTDKHIVDNSQVNLDFFNNSATKKDLNHMDDHYQQNEIDEDDDEEIITGHSHAAVNSGQASTATSESNSPHRVASINHQIDLNSSGDDDDNDNSDDKILTL